MCNKNAGKEVTALIADQSVVLTVIVVPDEYINLYKK